MDIHLIIAQYRGCSIPQYMPNVIEAWDEYMLDDNYEGWKAALDAAQAKVGDDYEAVRVMIVEVPDQAVVNLFEPPRIRMVPKAAERTVGGGARSGTDHN